MTIESESIPPPPLTTRLIDSIRHLKFMVGSDGGDRTPFFSRLEKAENYLARRFERDTPAEAEVFETIWGPIELGNEFISTSDL